MVSLYCSSPQQTLIDTELVLKIKADLQFMISKFDKLQILKIDKSSAKRIKGFVLSIIASDHSKPYPNPPDPTPTESLLQKLKI